MKKSQITQTIINDQLFAKGLDKFTNEFRILFLQGKVNIPKKILIRLGELDSLTTKISSVEQLYKVLE